MFKLSEKHYVTVEGSQYDYSIALKKLGSPETNLVFNPKRWANFVDLRYYIDFKLSENLSLQRHVGGNYYIRIEPDCVDLRDFKTERGVSLNTAEWDRLKCVFIQISDGYPNVAEVMACDHHNQESFFSCSECHPCGFNER